MTDQTEGDVIDKTTTAATTADTTANDTTQATGAAQDGADTTDGTKTAVTGTAADGADKADKGDKTASSDFPEDWRDKMAAGDEDIAKAIARYGSPKGVAKALKEAQAIIRSGKVKRDAPDAADEKAMAEWRKEQGIPDDPTGYVLPETVTKRMTDDDKPGIAMFTEKAFAKGAPQASVDLALESYFEMVEDIAAQQLDADKAAREEAEDTLRKDWTGGEYKGNLTLAHRFMESVPEVGAAWTEARLPDGRRLGDIPGFISWASDMGRNSFGDATFANSDTERKHSARKEEIEKIIGTDEYYEKGLDKEYGAILERELKRKK